MDKTLNTAAPPDPGTADAPTLLGRFEYSLLEQIRILGMDAYGAELGRELSKTLHRIVTAPQVYMTLERLAKRGLVRFENTIPMHVRGGRSRKRFILEASGARALDFTSASFRSLASSKPQEAKNDHQIECPA